MLRRFRSCLFLAFAVTPSIAAAQTPGLPVTVVWDANSESAVIGYRVYVGSAPSVYSEAFDTGNTTSFTYRTGIAGQRYYFAIAAYSAGPLEGPRSSEVSTVIAPSSTPLPSGWGGQPPPGGSPLPDGGGEVAPPGIVLEPATVDGTTVTLAWRAEGSLDAIEYLVEVGTTAGASDLYNAPVGTQTSVSSTVSSGSYFARVRARTLGDSSVLSNEVGFAVGESGCSAMPKTPREPSGSITAGVATLWWKQAGGATSYIVQAGTAPGRSDLFNGDVGRTRTLSANVTVGPPIYARVIAVNACGQSAASAELRIQ